MKRNKKFYSNLFRIFCLGAVLLSLTFGLRDDWLSSGKAASDASSYEIYLPIVLNQKKDGPVLLGIYPSSYWQPTVGDALEKEFYPVDTWSGKNLSLAGIFHYFEQYNTVANMLGPIWDNGYTPFANLYSTHSIQDIASGGIDSQIRAWARNYAVFTNNGQRMAYLAPLQEMNGPWVPYGSSNPSYYKAAFQRIVNIFEQEGVPRDSVKWVFAPNGWSQTGWPDFEDYYPGDDLIDIVGFSSYNYGYHPENRYPKWETPDQIIKPYIDRMRIMAPQKPIFIAQTGTTAYGPNGYDVSLKNQWLQDAYNLVAGMQGVRGIIYYNDNNKYDWAFYADGNAFSGYPNGVAHELYLYVSPSELQNMMLTP